LEVCGTKYIKYFKSVINLYDTNKKNSDNSNGWYYLSGREEEIKTWKLPHDLK
jgi:hypothetical protein